MVVVSGLPVKVLVMITAVDVLQHETGDFWGIFFVLLELLGLVWAITLFFQANASGMYRGVLYEGALAIERRSFICLGGPRYMHGETLVPSYG